MKYIILSIVPAFFLMSCYDVGVEREAGTLPETVMENWRSLPKEKRKPSVSFADAEFFMINRCYKINQTLVKKAAVRWDDGTTLYAFLSVAEDGYVCTSLISEHKLELLAADCGSAEEKIEAWDYMIATQGL